MKNWYEKKRITNTGENERLALKEENSRYWEREELALKEEKNWYYDVW